MALRNVVSNFTTTTMMSGLQKGTIESYFLCSGSDLEVKSHLKATEDSWDCKDGEGSHVGVPSVLFLGMVIGWPCGLYCCTYILRDLR